MITEEMLTAAAAELLDALADSLPNPEDCQYDFSPRFQRKMKKLIRRQKHPVLYPTIQRIACFVLVLLLGFMTIFAANQDARAGVLDWLRELLKPYVQYYASEAAPHGDVYAYELRDLPEGYEEISRKTAEGNTTIRYLDHNTDNILYFAYSREKERVSYYFRNTGYIRKETFINSQNADFYQAKREEDGNCIIWKDQQDKTFFCLSGQLSETELISIAEKITKIS